MTSSVLDPALGAIATASWHAVGVASVAVLVLGLALLLCPPLRRWAVREHLVRAVARRALRDRRAGVRRDLRAAARGGGFAPFPQGVDPAVPTTPVVVPPLGDGRPGERFLAPVPADARSGVLGADGSRQDAVVPLGHGRALLVVCLGRVGRVLGGAPLEAAANRPSASRATRMDDVLPVGEVVRVAGPDGADAWRHTYAVGDAVVTDTHVDHDGWAFVVGVLRRAGEDDLDGLADAVLRTWRWLPAAAPQPAPDPAPALPADPPRPDPDALARPDLAAAPEVLTLRGHDGAVVARCRCAAVPVAADVPAPDGTWTAAFVRLTATASLAVTSAPRRPADGGRSAREHLEAPPERTFGPPTEPVRGTLAVATAAGQAWARAFRVGPGAVRAEVRLDRGDRTWAWLLTHAPGEERVVRPALDAVLASWKWQDDAPAPPATP